MKENSKTSEALFEFKKKLPNVFSNNLILIRALTHRSFINENREALEDNERLEFLGDSILNFIVAEWIYHMFPEKPEGSLTRLRAALVHTEQLANFARNINLGSVLRLGKGEIQAGGRDRSAILCDAFEALIGAIFLAANLNAVKEFFLPLVENEVKIILDNHKDEDSKSKLQEWAQASGFTSPVYILESETGPDHSKRFTMRVVINERIFGVGNGSSKQIAEKEAAKSALIKLGIFE